MSQTGHPISPPPVPGSPASTGVRRHHTISASSRPARVAGRATISEETSEQQLGYDDEVVDQDWVGGVGAVGEESSLHRQRSLPTRYHRGIRGQSARQPGNITPRTLISLSSIAGHEGDEEDWERDMRGMRHEEDQQNASAENVQHQQVVESHGQNSNPSPLSPHFGPSHVPSPPPAASGVRRHQSLTYGTAGGVRRISSGLKRSGTLQAQIKHTDASHGSSQSPSPTNADEEYDYEDDGAPLSNPYEDDAYFTPPSQQGPYTGSQVGNLSPWGNQNEWRTTNGSFSHSGANSIDDVQRALSALEITSNSGGYSLTSNNYQQPAYPPRFNPSQPPTNQAHILRSQNSMGDVRKLQLVTDFGGGRKTPSGQGGHGPASASAYIPPIGQQQHYRGASGSEGDDRALTAGGSWDHKDRLLGGRASNPNLRSGYGYAQAKPGEGNVPQVPTIPQQYLQKSGGMQAPRLGASPGYTQGMTVNQNTGGGVQGFANSPIDVPSLIASKGYNPTNFDIRPSFARFFVIKSYTEDDVHKSLKYEIWSSTDPGNKRLDKAFKECAGRGPIYLFFSVNASGHFCGIAEMLTPVDYTRSSTVWASDKWKGVFKVRWIFVRDIPNANLRHIRLNNTQERKPVTNSRDTQELLPEAGHEMLRIFHTHPARTSLLQDFAFYELQAMQKAQVSQNPPSPPSNPSSVHSPQPQQLSPTLQPQQANQFAMSGSNANYMLPLPQMTPMMQMQMQMQMNANMNQQFGIPQAQAMHQSVMRHPSPGPGNGQNYMNMGVGQF